MVLDRFQDKHLSGLFIGIVLVKLRGECNIERSVRRSINAVKIGFLILKKFRNSFEDGGFMWKDVDENDEHFHFFPKDSRLGIGLVVTDESKKYPDPERNTEVNHEKFFEVFGNELYIYFKNNQQILDLNTDRFDNQRIIIYKPEVNFDKIKKKILYLKLDENEKEVSFQEFKKSDEGLGIVLDENEKVSNFIVKKEEKIHCFGYNALKNISQELFPVLRENQKFSV